MKRLWAIIVMTWMLPMLAGCSIGQSPKEVANNFLTAVQKADFDQASTWVESKDTTSELQKAKDPDGEKLAKVMLGKMTFELGKEEQNGDKATVEAKITSLDMGRIVAGAMKDIMAMAFATAFSNDPEKDKKTQEIAKQYFMNAINDPNAPKTTTDVKINLVKTQDGWKVARDNKELMSALIGNADKIFSNM